MGGSHPLPVSLILSPQPFGPFFIPISFVPLLYHTFKGLSRGFSTFLKNLFGWLYRTPTNALGCVAYYPRLLTPLLYHNLGDLSRGFYIFLRTSKSCFNPLGKSCVPSVFLPLTPIVYHIPYKKSRTFPKNFQLAPANSAPGQSPPVADIAQFTCFVNIFFH